MVKLVDTQASGACASNSMRVRVSLSVPNNRRGVAQLARVRVSGARGRGFKSRHPDQKQKKEVHPLFICFKLEMLGT